MSSQDSDLNGTARARIGAKLNSLLADAGLPQLSEATAGSFTEYLSLLLRWNARTNLTAIRDEDGILRRHFVESIACAHALPAGIGTLLDFGSGAGFPGLPIALCRPEIEITLAESQGKKSAFLREAVRVLEVSAVVHSGRAEALAKPFDCVTMRAVDHMEIAVKVAAELVREDGWLAPMTSENDLASIQSAAGASFRWETAVSLTGSDRQVLALGRRTKQ